MTQRTIGRIAPGPGFGGIGSDATAGRARPAMQLALAVGCALALAGCEAGQNPFAGLGGGGSEAAEGTEAAATPASSVRIVDRDVEAPEVFQVSDEGLWDGRPSLGGVWVAHATVKDPERVIIRNSANGKFVIGALFRRERDMPGPKLQISSDAAAALGMLAGQPTKLQVTALRREEVPVAEDTPAPVAAAAGGGDAIESKPLDPVAANAAAAIDKAEAKGAAPAGAATTAATTAAAGKSTGKTAGKPAMSPEGIAPAGGAAAGTAAPAGAAAAAPAATPAKPSGSVSKPYIQIGIFSLEANADKAAAQMKGAGLPAEVRKDASQGKSFWRVLVGPLSSAADRDAAVAKVKGLGYPDAYSVSK